MKSIRNFLALAALAVMLAVSMIVPAKALAQTPQPSGTSASSSKISATPAPDDAAFHKACAEAIQELKAARHLLQSQGVENQLQADMLVLERRISTGLKELRSLDASEKAVLLAAVGDLKSALADKDKALAAKDRAITSLEAANAVLKKNRWTFWKATKAVALGAAAGIVVSAVFLRN